MDYYIKLVSKDKKEIVARFQCGLELNDKISSMNFFNDEVPIYPINNDELKDLPSYIVSKNEKTNKQLLGYTDAFKFINQNIEILESRIKENGSKLENLKLKQLLAKTDVVYENITDSMSSLEFSIEEDKNTLSSYETLLHEIYYELDSRICFYRNNKPIYRNKEYKYRNIKDYDLYFFWS